MMMKKVSFNDFCWFIFYIDFCEIKYGFPELPPVQETSETNVQESSETKLHQREQVEKKKRVASETAFARMTIQDDDEEDEPEHPKKKTKRDQDPDFRPDNDSESSESESEPPSVPDSSCHDDIHDEIPEERNEKQKEGQESGNKRKKPCATSKKGSRTPGELQKRKLQEIFNHPPICGGCHLKLSPSEQIYKYLGVSAPGIGNRNEKEGYSSCVYRWTYANDHGRLINCVKCVEKLKKDTIEKFEGTQCQNCKREMVLKMMTEDKDSKYAVLSKAYNRKVAKKPLATARQIKNENKEIVAFELPTICNPCKRKQKHESFPVTKDTPICFNQRSEEAIDTVKDIEFVEGKTINEFLQGKSTDLPGMIDEVYKLKSKLTRVANKDSNARVYTEDLMEEVVTHQRKDRQASDERPDGIDEFIKAAEDGEQSYNSEWLLKNVIDNLGIKPGTRQSGEESVKSRILDYCEPFVKNIKFKSGYKNFDHYLRTLLSTIKHKYPERFEKIDGHVYWKY